MAIVCRVGQSGKCQRIFACASDTELQAMGGRLPPGLLRLLMQSVKLGRKANILYNFSHNAHVGLTCSQGA